ncbi:MAG: DUF4268 domain-containing protein [Bacteroidetes bacterium]|nr:MAG: DUF4268 domain-containing protein [Bacteroidota bacterium]PTM11088.1 MAG: DUF4268 domain-containing protein [Bacteroidota bacterium]
MYSKEEVTQLRKAFWTTFGQYLRPIPGSEGEKVNWINYRTGFKGMNFRMDANKQEAYIGIVFSQPNPDLRILFFEQLLELRSVLHGELGEEWIWEQAARNDQGQPISQVYQILPAVSIFQKADWPQLISFFKPRIIALDEFWSTAKYHFEPLG